MKIKKTAGFFPVMILAWCLLFVPINYLKADNMENAAKIKITAGGRVMAGLINNSKAGKDFLSLLPLSLTLTDYNSTEKISGLPQKLSAEGAPAGYDPEIGDITYYAPWGNLAIFYRDFGYGRGLVSLGKIISGMEALNASGEIEVKIELTD